jgi:hypothetical protein
MKVIVDKDIKNFIDLVNELDGLQDIKFTYVTSKEIDNDLLLMLMFFYKSRQN